MEFYVTVKSGIGLDLWWTRESRILVTGDHLEDLDVDGNSFKCLPTAEQSQQHY
jgi:hypothetical protein